LNETSVNQCVLKKVTNDHFFVAFIEKGKNPHHAEMNAQAFGLEHCLADGDFFTE